MIEIFNDNYEKRISSEGHLDSMKITCENCPDFATCNKLCPEIEDQLEPVIGKSKFDKELNHDWQSEEGGEIGGQQRIDLGKKFENVEDQDIEWTQTPVQPASAELDLYDIKVLKRAIELSIPSSKKKLKRWFNAFLRCSKIVDIADRAKVTKQNVQKQFQGVVRKIHISIKTSRMNIEYNPSPLKFKKRISEATNNE